MAHSWHYPRWRRALMQITMWLLLGGTVGLAAWVSTDRNARRAELLTQGVSLGTMHLSLPADWVLTSDPRSDGVLLARPRAEEESNPRLTAQLFPVPDHRSVKQFLFGPDGPLADQAVNLENGNNDDSGSSGPAAAASTPLPFGNTTGLLIKLSGVEVNAATGPLAVTRWIACGVFGTVDRQALYVELDVPHDPADPADPPPDQDEHARLLRAIAASVRWTAPARTGNPSPPV